MWTSHGMRDWVMSHMNESCHIWMSHGAYEWVMTHMNESWHVWLSYVTYDLALSAFILATFVRSTQPYINDIHVWHHIHMRHKSSINVPHTFIHMWHKSSISAMTHSRVPWLIHMCHDLFICDITRSYVPWPIHKRHDSLTCAMTPPVTSIHLHIRQKKPKSVKRDLHKRLTFIKRDP